MAPHGRLRAPAGIWCASSAFSAYYHDSAAALVVDGVATAAAQEERFSRKKHDSRFPQQRCVTASKAKG